MRADPSEPVIALWLKCQGLSVVEELFRAGFDLLTKRVFGWTACAIAGFGAVPPDQAKPNAFCATIREALQLERISVDRKHVAYRCVDASRARLIAEVFGFRRDVALAASRKTQA